MGGGGGGGGGGGLKCCQKIPVKEFKFAGYKPANVLKMKFTHIVQGF